MATLIPSNQQSCVPSPVGWELHFPHRYWKTSIEKGALVVTISTPHLLDDVLADAFFPELEATITGSGNYNVLLDLQQVKSISAEALKPLHELAHSLKVRGGRLAVCGLSDYLAEVFHIDALSESTPELELRKLTS